MRIKKILAAVPTLICAAGMSITAFAEDRFPLDGDDDTLYEAEEASIYDDIREGYYICHISYHGGAPEIYAEDGSGYSLVGEIGGYIGGGETRESVEKEITESVRNDFVSIGVNPDDYAFDVYAYFYDDYDLTPEEFLNFVSRDIAEQDAASVFADNDITEDEPEAIYDEPHKGEGYYTYHVSFHDGAPKLYDINGDAYDFWVDGGGYIREGETREDIENSVAEDMRDQLASMDVNPDDSAFDVYVYYFDDYALNSTEFNDFVIDDIFRRDSERDTQAAEVLNPVTGTGLPIAAAVLAALSVAGVLAVGRKKLS